MLIDSHCHLHNTDYDLPIDEIISQAHQAGVDKMVTIGTSSDDSRLAVEFAKSHPSVFATVGVHPSYSTSDQSVTNNFDLSHSKIVAIGEVGLDYHYPDTDKKSQAALLRQQIELAIELKLPLVFHVREAFDDFWKIADDYSIEAAVMHSFSDNLTNLKTIIEKNWLIGVNGIATFSKNQAQLEAFRAIPLERLVLETDAPYLSPAGKRGRINQPAYVRDVAEFLADFYGVDFEQLAQVTTANTERLFGI